MDSSKNTAIFSIALGIFFLSSGVSTVYAFAVGIFTVLQVVVCLYYDALVAVAAKAQAESKHHPRTTTAPTTTTTTTTTTDRGVTVTKQAPTNIVVDELFPEVVRHRLYQQKQAVAHDEQPQEPILDSYPEATVLFADLVGFTAWSASRSMPHDVFCLLETLYAAFDKLASQHDIFKVETIGDCYLAMAGAPMPDPLHAQHMVQFALDMMVAADRILRQELAPTLGTAHLQLRVGVHSGPIVAGVLRGAKSRFQVFGDTINTASRMESTSSPSCIQVSRAVRDSLTCSSDASEQTFLLRSRQDLVEAKGKGLMKTYWLESATPELEEEDDDIEVELSSAMSKTAVHMCSGLDDTSCSEDPRAQFCFPRQASRSHGGQSMTSLLISKTMLSSMDDCGPSMASIRLSSFMLSSIDDCFAL
jgi:class 3 adenylate cyclase